MEGDVAACVYLKCKQNPFSKANPKRGDIGFTRIFVVCFVLVYFFNVPICVHFPFTENYTYQIIFQTLCMQDLVNYHNNFNVEVRATFLYFSYKEAEPQRSEKKLYQDYTINKWQS